MISLLNRCFLANIHGIREFQVQKVYHVQYSMTSGMLGIFKNIFIISFVFLQLLLIFSLVR